MLNIICEIANGYYGSVAISKSYIEYAKKNGANAVKFQIAYAEEMLEEKDKIFKIIKKNEMNFTQWKKIRDYARLIKIKFYLDIDGIQAFDIAKALKPDGIKIHTTSFFDKRLIKKSLDTFKKVYISISGINEREFDTLYRYLKKNNKLKKVVFLYGHQNAPTKIEDTNLSRLINLKNKYNLSNIGFMDHVDGSSIYKYSLSILALGLGVRCFEKHLTKSRSLKLIDHISALEPNEFKIYSNTLNAHLKSIGIYNKKLTKSEQRYRKNAITVIYSKNNIKKNQRITYKNITHKRPLKYSNKYFYDPANLIGKIASCDILENQPIKPRYIK